MKRFLVVIGGGAASGLLLALALPPSDHWWLGPICLAPVLTAVLGKGLLRGFVGGITVPVACSCAILARPQTSDQGGPAWVLAGCGFFGFVVALICGVAGETNLSGWRLIGLLGPLGVVLEFAPFPILPAHIALTQYRMGGMLLLASFGGIWLVSLLLWSVNAAVADGLRRSDRRPMLTMLGVLLVSYALTFAPYSDQGAKVRVGVIQTEANDRSTLGRLNAEAGRKGAELTVWPEFSGIVLAPQGNADDLRHLSAEAGQPPFVTTFRDGTVPMPHNAAALFINGSESEHYNKRKVFGGEAQMHLAGTRSVAVDWPNHPKVGLCICYDLCYPRIVSETAALSGTGLIALPTIDPDSPNSFFAGCHEAFTPFRAAESGVPIARADGIAYSAIVDRMGRIVSELGPRVEGVLVGDIALGRRWTLYSVLGDWVLYLCGLWVLSQVAIGLGRTAS